MELLLIGIGTGNPEHLTLQAIRTRNRAIWCWSGRRQ